MVKSNNTRSAVNAVPSLSTKTDDGLFFRVTVPLPGCDPWQFARCMKHSGEGCVYWQSDGAFFAAVGSVASATFEGPGRFAEADAWFSAVQRQLLGRSTGPDLGGVPLVVGGFAFDDSSGPQFSDPWYGWKANALHVPRLVVFRREGTCGVVSTERLRVGHQPLGCRERLSEEIAEALEKCKASEAGMARTHGSNTQLEFVRNGDEEERERFHAGVESVLDALDSRKGGESLTKVVVARRLAMRYPTAIDTNAVVDGLRANHAQCTIFGFQEAGGRTFAGATPELLARKSGDMLATRALAGTRRRPSGTHGETLLESEKDRREHRIVVDAIENALKPFVVRTDADPVPTIRSLRDVNHLETAICAELKEGASLLQAVGSLHPTPAVGGTPDPRAREFIRRVEHAYRGWFTGPVGWMDCRGDGEFHVALRCGLIHGNHAWGFAGAGIVNGSQPAAEWEETCIKLKAFESSVREAVEMASEAE